MLDGCNAHCPVRHGGIIAPDGEQTVDDYHQPAGSDPHSICEPEPERSVCHHPGCKRLAHSHEESRPPDSCDVCDLEQHEIRRHRRREIPIRIADKALLRQIKISCIDKGLHQIGTLPEQGTAGFETKKERDILHALKYRGNENGKRMKGAEPVVVEDEEHEAVNEAEKRRMDPGCPVYDDEDRNKGEECNPGNACITCGAGKGQRGDTGTKDQKKSFYDKI